MNREPERLPPARARRRHAFLHRLRRRGPALRIEAYRGWGTPVLVHIRGRVLRDAGVRVLGENAGSVLTLKNMLRRSLTDEVPFARVRATLGAAVAEGRADREGFFELELRAEEGLRVGPAPWQEVLLELLEPEAPAGAAIEAVARVLVPASDAEFGVISDIDDTIIRTDATSLLRMMRIVLLHSVQRRLPFDHVEELYRALQRGSDGARHNPIFYLSSSPWNLFDMLTELFRVHGVPEGPLLLRDWNFSPRKLFGMDHRTHKLDRIRELLHAYPTLPWVLIGDSGQEDPEIYREAVLEHPGRVVAVYIRSVAGARREAEVRAIAREVEALGAELRLVEGKVEAAAHASARGLITASSVEAMLGPRSVRADRRRRGG
jgi:phosphatidate phosphatase APP1